MDNILHDLRAKGEISQEQNTCVLPKNVQVHVGSSGSEADVSQPHSRFKSHTWTAPHFTSSDCSATVPCLLSCNSCHQIVQEAAKNNPGRGNHVFKIGMLLEGKPVPGRWKWTPLDHTTCLRAAQPQHRCGQQRSFCHCQQISQVWGMSKMEICSCERTEKYLILVNIEAKKVQVGTAIAS